MVEPREVSGSQRASGNLTPDRVQIKLLRTRIYAVAYIGRGLLMRRNMTRNVDAGTPMRPDKTRLAADKRPVLNRSLSETPVRSDWGSCSPARGRSR
jgi:hypothetical protein